MRCLLLVAVAAFATIAPGLEPATAQSPRAENLPTAVGARVRATPAQGARVTGVVLGYRADSLVLLRAAPNPDTLSLALGTVRRLDVSLGRRRRVGRGLLWGLAAGALFGASVGGIAGAVDDDQGNGYEGPIAGAFAIAGGGIGAVVGGALGMRRVKRWESVLPRGRAARVVVAP